MEKMKIKTAYRYRAILIIVILIAVISVDQPLADTMPALDGASLIEQAKALNGQDVSCQGEVIGDIMPRQDHYWINVLNNGTAVGIWITAEQRSLIGLAGRYGIQGDEVKIIGRFNRACSEHGGDLDIHAHSIEIVSKGYYIPQKLNITRLIIAAGFFILAVYGLIMLMKHRFLQRN
ncbi:MAG: hypothetical protein VB070_00485 [Clostridiaceae bacterium]|nr:hypothetical protein [Clostridiaceae bacterium]